jgi:hypothetical protein
MWIYLSEQLLFWDVSADGAKKKWLKMRSVVIIKIHKFQFDIQTVNSFSWRSFKLSLKQILLNFFFNLSMHQTGYATEI